MKWAFAPVQNYTTAPDTDLVNCCVQDPKLASGVIDIAKLTEYAGLLRKCA